MNDILNPDTTRLKNSGFVHAVLYVNLITRQRHSVRLLEYQGPNPDLYQIDGYALTHINGHLLGVEATTVSRGDTLQFTKTEKGIETAIIIIVAAAVLAYIGASGLVAFVVLTAAALYAVKMFMDSYAQKPDVGGIKEKASGGADERNSPTYQWGATRPVTDMGGPIPVWYGPGRVAGTIIGMYQTVDKNGENTLKMLILLSEGRGTRLGQYTSDQSGLKGDDLPEGMKINGNDATSYQGITVDIRFGTHDQETIDGFDDDINEFAIDIELLKDDVFEYTTDGIVDKFGFLLSLPNGLNQANETTGATMSFEVKYEYRWRKTDGGSWSSWTKESIKKKKMGAFKAYKEQKVSERAQYDIQIKKTTKDSTESQYIRATLKLDSMREITNRKLRYPGLFLVAVTALASKQLNDKLPSITFDGEGKYFADEDRALVKPGEVVKDILGNTTYGGGAMNLYSHFDSNSFDECDDYADDDRPDGHGDEHPRYRIAAYFDFQTSVWEASQKIAASGRAALFKTGNLIKCRVAKPRDYVMVIGDGDIMKGTFKTSYKNPRTEANQVTVEFLDVDNDFQRTAFTIESPTLNQRGIGRIPKTYSYVGLANKERAKQEALYLLNSNKYTIRTMEMDVRLVALLCDPFDVVAVSHKVPQYGHSGFVRMGSSLYILRVDQDLEFREGYEYAVTVQHENGTIDRSVPVVTQSGYSSVLTLAQPLSSVPTINATYSFGRVGYETKPMVVSELSRRNNESVFLRGPEYYEELFDDDPNTLPGNPPYSDLPGLGYIPADVTQLSATERYDEANKFSYVDVGWAQSEDASYYEVWSKVDVEVDDDDEWERRGVTHDNTYTFLSPPGSITGCTLRVCVVPVSARGEKKLPDEVDFVTVTVYNGWYPPNPVENGTWTSNASFPGSPLAWVYQVNCVYEHDRRTGDYYEMRAGGWWNQGTPILKPVPFAFNDYAGENASGEALWSFSVGVRKGPMTYIIRAVHESGAYSVTSVEKTFNFPAAFFVGEPDVAVDTTYTSSFSGGSLTNLSYDGTKQGWFITNWEGLETYGKWESPSYDFGATVATVFGAQTDCRFSINAQYKQDVVGLEAEDFFWDAYWTFEGKIDAHETWYTVEVRFSPDNSTWTDWYMYDASRLGDVEKVDQAILPGAPFYAFVPTGNRYMQVRLTLNKKSQNIVVPYLKSLNVFVAFR